MPAPAITVACDAPLSEALALMREHDVRRLPVVLDTGKLCGMVTQGDIRGADVLRVAGLDALAVADALRRLKVDMECRFSDKVARVAEATASFQLIHV
jgi:acetoin utilization protein AcuB/CBS domain-containing protein